VFAARSTRSLLRRGQSTDLVDDLRNGADVGQVVEGNSDIEVVFEFADELEHLQRVKAEIGEQFTFERRTNRPPAQSLQDRKSLALKAIGRRCILQPRRVVSAARFRDMRQIVKIVTRTLYFRYLSGCRADALPVPLTTC
jgi:hypothetical protein